MAAPTFEKLCHHETIKLVLGSEGEQIGLKTGSESGERT
jgi:hypothetical protein